MGVIQVGWCCLELELVLIMGIGGTELILVVGIDCDGNQTDGQGSKYITSCFGGGVMNVFKWVNGFIKYDMSGKNYFPCG